MNIDDRRGLGRGGTLLHTHVYNGYQALCMAESMYTQFLNQMPSISGSYVGRSK